MTVHGVHSFVVPGSTSNLGPGFDTLSVALDVYLTVEILGTLPSAGLETAFAGSPPPGDNRLETAFRAAEARFGAARAGLRVRVRCDIPMAAGLGSSAAAAIAGLRLYELAAERELTVPQMLGVATGLEGHPDNAAASLLGGMTTSCQTEAGEVISRSWAWPPAIRFIVATPDVPLHTAKARAVLPATVPLRDAVANLQRTLLLVRALQTGDFGDIREGLRDRWHQPARAPLIPGLAEALAIEHPAVLGVALSGAGPSVLALAAPGRADEAASLLEAVYGSLGIPHTIRNLGAHEQPLPRPAAFVTREKTA